MPHLTNQELIAELNVAYGHLSSPVAIQGPWDWRGVAVHMQAGSILEGAAATVGELLARAGLPTSVQLSVRLVMEEHAEFVEAYLSGDAEDALEELADTEIVNKRVAALHGWDSETALRRKLAANTSKLINGKPTYDAGGKVVRGSSYKPADMSDLVNVPEREPFTPYNPQPLNPESGLER